jgi:hypothetical protein
MQVIVVCNLQGIERIFLFPVAISFTVLFTNARMTSVLTLFLFSSIITDVANRFFLNQISEL